MSTSNVSDAPERIAIVGMAGRFPGARNLDEFWENLKNGVESVRFFTDEELLREGIAAHLLSNESYVKANAILDDADLFDADFFGFTPREAEFTDPQHRIFLECAWEALENAGYDTARYQGMIGLYGGVSLNTYLITNLLSNRQLIEKIGFLQTSILNRTDHLTTHAAYKLNLKGPSVTVQTNCSTSLVAVHQACQALLNYQCDIALAGGVTITIPDKTGYLYQEGGIGSPDGHCRAFDARANGTVSGNGAGVVVLKRLSDVLSDGDCVRAVIRSTAINNDGAEKIGYTAPSVSGQAQVIAMAQAIAEVSPEEVSYIEAHGTGTPLGDPIEIEALTQVFRNGTALKRYCAIGSVKTNIGHLDTAAGVAGLIKTTLAMEHKQLPPSLHFSEPNPRINFSDSPFYVNATLSAWEADGRPRIAGVSSFGIGGTNAHAIVEEPPEIERQPSSRSHHLLVLSARTGSALDTMTTNLAVYLREHPQADLGDVAYTLQVGRRAFSVRRALLCQNHEDALAVLTMADISKVVTGSKEAAKCPVAFMFPGQGSQYVNMAVELYKSEADFRQQVDRCSELLTPHLGFPLQELLFPENAHIAEASERLKQTAFAQPALFVIEYALAQLLIRWGIQPEAMIGHSIGEYVAACMSGVMSLEDALKLVAARGRLMQKLPGGSMLSVPLTEKEVRSRLNGELEIAAVNSPSLCVVAGADEAVSAFEAALLKNEVACRRLHTSHAFHTSMMTPILDQFLGVLNTVTLNPPERPYISNLTGEWITNAEATSPAYWAKHLRQTVQFGKGLSKLFQDPAWILLEVGPGRALMTMARWHPQKPAGQMVLTTLPPPDVNRSSAEFLLMTLGQLWVSGVEPRWESLYQADPRGRLPLPTYPFERQRYWIEAKAAAPALADSLEKDPNPANWFYVPSWKRSVQPLANDRQPSGKEASQWLLFVDQLGLGQQIVEGLRQSAKSIVTVASADSFTKLGAHDYALNPASPADYLQLFAQLAREGLMPDRIAYLWSVVPVAEEDTEAAPDEGHMASPDFYRLLYVAQALGSYGGGRVVHIDIVSSNMHEVTGAEVVRPEQATLMGPCRVIPQEYAGVTCRIIDVDSGESLARGGADPVEHLLEELREPCEENVAYRNNHRWIELFEQVGIETSPGLPSRLRRGGVYLITGGLGGMGLTIAEYLAREVQARLVLVGRSSLPPREQWSEWLESHGGEGREVKTILSLMALESSGAEVLYCSADVTDHRRMHEVIEQATERFGAINGVVHAAGLAGGGIIQLKTAAKADEVLAAKVAGTRVLQSVLRGQELDFWILCSSRSALLGGFGGVDYCAANAFLDAFAHRHRKQTGDFVVSVNWPAWQDVGMLAETAAASRARRGAPAHESVPFGHPLIDGYTAESQDRHVFHSRFQVKTHWMLDEHRIIGTAVGPGVAYLEMARAAFEKTIQPGSVEIRDAYFMTPLLMKDDATSEVRLVLERNGEGDSYEFYVESAPADETSSASAWHRHVIGKIASLRGTPPRWVDLGGLIKECSRADILLTDEDCFDADLGPRWQSMKRVFLGDNELVALMELPDEYAGELENFVIHPALMDRAAGFGILFLVERESSYLPFSYHRMRVYSALQQRFYVHSKGRGDSDPNKETISFDIEIIAEDGTLLIEIDNFTHKRINEIAKGVKTLVVGNQMHGEGYRQPPEGVSHDGASNEEGGHFERALSRGLSPSEGVEAFAQILAHSVPPQVVVSPNSLEAVIRQARQMRPGDYEVKAESLPVTPSVHARPDVQTAYVPPAGDLENRIAAIWQELLGIDRVGIHDNFFELGGDSVLAIQIMANAKKAGLGFTVQQLFQHPTIAELTAITDGAQPTVIGTAADTGELLPAQSQFFESGSDGGKPPRWSLLLEVDAALEASLLEKSLLQVVAAHEALRLSFPSGLSSRLASVTPVPSRAPLEVIDISDLPPQDRFPAIAATARRIQSDFQIDEGALMKFVLFQTGENEKSALLIVAHQTAADLTSAKRLLKDLQSAIDGLQRDQGEPLSSGAPRYREVVGRILEFAQSTAIRKEAGYWLEMKKRKLPSLPTLRAEGETTGADAAIHRVQLGHNDTQTLVNQALRAYHTRVEDFVLASLVKVFCEWAGEDLLWIDYQCRLEHLPDLNLRDVIGPFTTVAPVTLDMPHDDEPGQFLTAIKEQVRAIPRGGSSYALLRYLHDDQSLRESLGSLPRPSIRFSYLGELESSLGEALGFRLHPAAPLLEAEIPESWGYPIAIQSFVHDGRLKIHWSYDRAFIVDETIRMLADRHTREILSLISHCVQRKSEIFTSADFPLANLNSRKLDKISKLLEKADKSAMR